MTWTKCGSTWERDVSRPDRNGAQTLKQRLMQRLWKKRNWSSWWSASIRLLQRVLQRHAGRWFNYSKYNMSVYHNRCVATCLSNIVQKGRLWAASQACRWLSNCNVKVSWSQFTGSQPTGDLSHTPSSRLLLFTARPAVTFPATDYYCPMASTKLYCLCLLTRTHRCEQFT